MSNGPLTVERLEQGAIWRVTLGGSKGNILDGAAMDALTALFNEAAATRDVKAIVLEGEGKHFSFGASVPEHLPGQVDGMLKRFGAMLLALVDCSVPVFAAVRGQCLGGGLELVMLAHRIFASEDAKMGQPEIVLGVFAPIASLVLPGRVGRGPAEDICITGRSIGGAEAKAIGLVDELVADPAEAAIAYAKAHLLPKSASSVRYAVRAVRADLRAKLANELPLLERIYLDGLMSTGDAQEGLKAFMEKRGAVWQNA